jgi:hypothetical protein
MDMKTVLRIASKDLRYSPGEPYSLTQDRVISLLVDERTELKAEVAKRTKTLMVILALQKDGEAEIAELRVSLAVYGAHDRECKVRHKKIGPCTCGFDAALAPHG